MKYTLSDIFEGDYKVSQYYGVNATYYSQFGLKGHEGVDWATPVGVKVLAPFDGIILRDNDDFKNNNYGDFIVIWDKVQKCAVWFCHLSQNNVSLNQSFKKGQVLGLTGNSGNSSGPHLHINFVETDNKGNRLNMSNGFQGFLNILDSSLVNWQLQGSQAQQPPSAPAGTIPIETAKYEELVRKASESDKYVSLGYETPEKIKQTIDNLNQDVKNREADTEKQKEIVTNLNQLLTGKTNTIASLNSKISTLETQVLNLTSQVKTLSEQANKVPDLVTQVGELEKRKQLWADTEDYYKKTIKSKNAEIKKLQDSWVTAMLQSIISTFKKEGDNKNE